VRLDDPANLEGIEGLVPVQNDIEDLGPKWQARSARCIRLGHVIGAAECDNEVHAEWG
jgi:hypothetical protein